jgi:hypothetical protein
MREWRERGNQMKFKYVAIATLFAFAGNANAQSAATAGPKGTILTFVRGRCSTLVLAGKDMTAECTQVLVNAAYPTGNSSFMFTVGGNAMVSFFGRDNPAIGDHAMIYLQRVSFRDSSPDNPSSEVSGICTYANPFAGPAVIDCKADSKDGPFRAVFTTDGRQPQITRL